MLHCCIVEFTHHCWIFWINQYSLIQIGNTESKSQKAIAVLQMPLQNIQSLPLRRHKRNCHVKNLSTKHPKFCFCNIVETIAASQMPMQNIQSSLLRLHKRDCCITNPTAKYPSFTFRTLQIRKYDCYVANTIPKQSKSYYYIYHNIS